MFKRARTVAVVALTTGLLGFIGLAAGAAGMAKVLLVWCLLGFLMPAALAVAGAGASRRRVPVCKRRPAAALAVATLT